MIGGVKEKTMSFLKTTTTKNYSKQRRINNVHAGKKKPRKPRKTF